MLFVSALSSSLEGSRYFGTKRIDLSFRFKFVAPSSGFGF